MNKLEIFLYAVCVSLMFKGGITPEFISSFKILSELIVYTWSLAVVNLVFCGGALNWLGIRPRTSIGILGIFCSPFLHGNWGHLIVNTLPFLILGWFVMLGGIREFFIITVFVALFNGLGIWLCGRPYKNYIGASGVIFGYLGFLLARSYFSNDLLSIVVTAIVGLMYGRSLRGIFPQEEGIAWDGHLLGLIGGIFAASLLDTFRVILPTSINGVF